MSHGAPLPSAEKSLRRADPGVKSHGLTESLRRALTELGASAIGVTRTSGGPPKYFTRSASAAAFFEEICANALVTLQAQTQSKGGVFGTNRVRSNSDGPVRGRLIAVTLIGPRGAPLGTLIAVRLIEEEKFGARESQKLLDLVPEFVELLLPQPQAAITPPAGPPEPVYRGMWPTQAPNTTEAAPAATAAPATLPDATAATGTASPPAPEAALAPTKAADASIAAASGASASATSKDSASPAPAETPADIPEISFEIGPDASIESQPDERAIACDAAAAHDDTDVAEEHPVRTDEAPIEPSETSTNLLGWTAFERQIRTQEAADKLPGCVLYGDIDQLHVLNKLAGFATGDLAIAEVGAALQTFDLPPSACSCHLSGDRFTVYVPRTTLAQARRIAEQLCKRVKTLSVDVHTVPTPISISFGVAVIPAKDGGLGHALAAAEAACKTAKDRGRGRVEVYQDADQSIVRRNDDVLVADRLRQALDAGRVEVFAQPIVRLDGSRATTNYELLARLKGEAGTHLSPAWFMSAATRYRMLVDLDRAVIAHVLGKLEAQRAALSKRKLRFSVNLSGPTIGDPDFLEWISVRIGGGGVPGEWLQFEITETAAVANVAQTQTMIRRLKARGVQFALDDFGTGVSSFAYLKFFDVTMLKLDGAFVRDLLGNPRSESLVRGIAQLGRGMNIETVAECVETADVRDRLAELGIDCAQGFLFGRPKPFDGVLAAELGLQPPEQKAAEPGAI